MQPQEIYLQRSADQPSQEILVGINGDIEINDRITQAVEASTRLFPYVVRHIASNRAAEQGMKVNPEQPGQLTEHMRSVRDELSLSLQGIKEARRVQRLRQADNMTKNVRPDRPPYFVR